MSSPLQKKSGMKNKFRKIVKMYIQAENKV